MGTRSDSVVNALCYAVTGKHYLEGRYDERHGIYRNWSRSYVVDPERFLRPQSEEHIREIVDQYERIGLVGAGHSFNDLHLHRRTLISLDRYTGLVQLDVRAKTATFRAGTRLRDVARILKELELALPVLPDHNAQSLGGILATDVHASGRPGQPAHVSEAVTHIRLVDGLGNVRTVFRGQPLFRATIGGMGCTGIIAEVGLQCVEPFHVATHAFRCSWGKLMKNLEVWREENQLLAAGYFPHIDACVVEVKNRTSEPLTRRGPAKETRRHVTQAIVQTLALPYARRPPGIRRELARWLLSQATEHLQEHAPLVLDNFEGFNRNVYQVHSEAEFTVPAEKAREVLERGRELLRANPEQAYYLLGLRMSQSNTETLVGPGAGAEGGQLAWIAPHLDGNVLNPAHDAKWRELCEKFDGRPHYGKNLLGLRSAYLARVHGENWNEFLRLVRIADPHGKFTNELVGAPQIDDDDETGGRQVAYEA
jgi:FAD/FMN-containing dehydrogenase